MTAETLAIFPKQQSRSLEAKHTENDGGSVEDKLTGDTSVLKRKRTDNEGNQDSKPALKKLNKEGGVLEAFGEALPPNVANAPSNLKKTISHQASLSESTSLAATSKAASTEVSQNASQLLSRSTAQAIIQDSELSLRLPSTGDGALKLVCRSQQAVESNGGPNPLNQTAGFLYPKFQTGPQPMPRIPPSYSNHTIIPPDLNPFQQTYQQLQQHLITADTPPHLNLSPYAPGPLLPFQPQTQLPPYLYRKTSQCNLFQIYYLYGVLYMLAPTMANDLTTTVKIPTRPGNGGRSQSRTIQRFADILMDLIESQATKAVTAEWASRQSRTKVDQGVQTDIPESQTTEAGTQIGDKLEALDIETIRVRSTPESESGHRRGYGRSEDLSEAACMGSGHQ